jgi:hypothetical protein
MATTTTNFGWDIPQSTDLVKDGATAIAALGQDIDTALVDLKGGTTGQVLAKASNTDLDYSWVTTDDANAIQNSIVDAKGDLVAASANDTPARLAVGNNGETLVADSSTSTGLRYQGSQAAAKNYLINGAMDFWQRGTSSTSLGYVTADRWYINNAGGTTTSAQETTIVPSVARYALKLTQSVSSAQVVAQQPLESQLAIPLAGQNIIVSAYVAASASTNFTIDLGQSTSTDVAAAGSWTFTSGTSQNVASTTYVRVSQTFTVTSTSKSLMPRISMTSLGSGNSFYISGVQMEISAVPTTFTRAGGTIQGELAACQRYYNRLGKTTGSAAQRLAVGPGANSTTASITFYLPVNLRTNVSAIDFSGLQLYDGSATFAVTTATINAADSQNPNINCVVASGLTAKQFYELLTTSSAGYLGLSAEL